MASSILRRRRRTSELAVVENLGTWQPSKRTEQSRIDARRPVPVDTRERPAKAARRCVRDGYQVVPTILRVPRMTRAGCRSETPQPKSNSQRDNSKTRRFAAQFVKRPTQSPADSEYPLCDGHRYRYRQCQRRP